MKLLKQLSEDHESVKVSTSGGSYEKDMVTVYIGSSGATFRFKGMPTEIVVQLGDEDSTPTNFAYMVRGAISDKYAQLKLKNKEAAEKFWDEHSDKFYSGNADVNERLEAELQEEIGEIIDHLTVMLKARVVAYMHDYKQANEKASAEAIRELTRLIDDELSK